MADLYGTNNLSSALESEEMFSFPPNLPPNSSATPSPSPFTSFKANICSFSSLPPPPPVAEETASTAGLVRLSAAILFDSDFCLGDGVSTAVVDSSSNHNFSDSGGLFTTGAKESIRNSFSSGGAAEFDAITSSMKRRKFSTEDDVDDIDFDCEGEVLVDPIMPRSSKRTRAAEIHNLTEKRRRSKINEKLKALQNLIPNSNKTDKASMLDEAIEYLKQLQLQVQMLTMRNGLNLHPVYLSETLQPRQLP